MKEIKHLRFVKSADLEWFTEEMIRITEELQGNGWQVEYDYRPLMDAAIIYTCMVRAFVNVK